MGITTWISVPLPPDTDELHWGRGRSLKRNNEIKKWISEQWEAGAIKQWKTFHYQTFSFSREEDAVAFKLRWV